MTEWLEELFKEIIWEALVDFYTDIATWGESQIETKLKELQAEVGKEKPLSSSPLVRVSDYTTTSNPNVDHITFLIRGRVSLFKGVESVFMRVEVTISTDVDLLTGGPPIEIIEWITIIGDLKISKKNVFNANLGFGYDNGSWLGRGALKILPAGFGLDIFLGGLSDRGAMIGLSIDLPAPIPLGSTGLGLAGMGGNFAYNFVARLEKGGLPITDPTAEDYVRWARDDEPLNRWIAGPIDKTAVGVGINTDLVTLADNGYIVKLEPIGLAVLTPGPIFILGGVGKLLNTNSARVEGYLAVDIASASMALGLGVKIMIPKPKDGSSFGKNEKYLIGAHGTLDAFFSFKNPSLWYVNLGTEDKKLGAKIITDLFRAELYFMINNNRIAFGAGISVGGKWEWWIITLTARIGADVAALIGWNPVELEGMFRIWGELGLKVWKFGFMLRGSAEVVGHTPKPSKLDVTFKYKLDLPWPIPDIEGDKTFTWGDTDPLPPTISAPLLVGSAVVEGQNQTGPMELGLLHALTGRQWSLDPTSRDCWPDVEIVVPFSSRAADDTGKVVGAAVSGALQGGYLVEHTLKTLELLDITHDETGTPVSGLQAVWAAGPGGDTARLHVNGQDPFSWVVPHVDTVETTIETPGKTVEQGFGYGPREAFGHERRFGEMLVDPLGGRAQLVTYFQPALPTRVLRDDSFRLRFRTASDKPVQVEEITLFLVGARGEENVIQTSHGTFSMTTFIKPVYGTVFLIAVTIPLSSPQDEIEIKAGGKEPLHVYAVRYREKRQTTCNWQERIVLKPGTYKISLSGESQATDPAGELPSSTVTTWQVEDTFRVNYPETLRPYIHYTTIGDNRIFFDEKLPWNPTMYGFGFPIYQKYQAAVRFLVPYMGSIFSTIIMRLVYETGEILEQTMGPVANGSGETFLPGASQTWITNHCGTVQADQEIALTDPYPKAGPAGVFLLFNHPNGKQIKLDEWTCYVSQFDSFQHHLAWNQHCLTVLYRPSGRAEVPCCGGIPTTPFVIDRSRVAQIGNRIDPLIIERVQPRNYSIHWDHPLLEIAYPFDDDDDIFPTELTAPPASWRLPTGLSALLNGGLNASAGYRFARFAAQTGSRFNAGSGDMLDGINDTVAETTVEAVVDAQGRPWTLWLRTPEPLDWRRVTATLRIHHVKQTGDCPTAYEKRHPLDLQIEILPSPDASSAFLVGSLAGQRTRLPRGEYELKLTFDPKLADLTPLRPTAAVGSTPEQVTYKFIQPSGQPWPLPSTGIIIPANVLEWLVKWYKIDWSIIDLLNDPKIDPKVIEKMIISELPQPGPRPPVAAETLTSLDLVTGETLQAAPSTTADLAALTTQLAAQPETVSAQLDASLTAAAPTPADAEMDERIRSRAMSAPAQAGPEVAPDEEGSEVDEPPPDDVEPDAASDEGGQS